MSSKKKTTFETVDYEELDEPVADEPDMIRPDDFMSIFVDKLYNFDWVFLFIIAILFIIVLSDVYGETILRRIDGTFDKNDDITTKGHMVQLGGMLISSVIARFLFALAGI